MFHWAATGYMPVCLYHKQDSYIDIDKNKLQFCNAAFINLKFRLN